MVFINALSRLPRRRRAQRVRRAMARAEIRAALGTRRGNALNAVRELSRDSDRRVRKHIQKRTDPAFGQQGIRKTQNPDARRFCRERDIYVFGDYRSSTDNAGVFGADPHRRRLAWFNHNRDIVRLSGFADLFQRASVAQEIQSPIGHQHHRRTDSIAHDARHDALSRATSSAKRQSPFSA